MAIQTVRAVRSRDACTLAGAYCTMDAKPESVDTLKLSPNQWRKVRQALKSKRLLQSEAQSMRRHHRHDELDMMQIVIEVVQPGGTISHVLARAQNISTSGIGFFHGRFIYSESRCTVWLKHAVDGLTPLSGTIRWCTHLVGNVHISGLELDDQIDVFRYLPQGDMG